MCITVALVPIVAGAEDVIGYLREQQISLIYDPADGVLRVATGETAQTITLEAS